MSKKGFSGNVAGAIHQHTADILATMGLVVQTMHCGDVEAALRHLSAALVMPKPADVPEDLLGEVDRERALLAQLQPTRRNERMRVNVAYYEGLRRKAWKVFWSKGYLTGEAYGSFYDPSAGRRSQ